MHENPQRVSSVVRVDVSGPYLQGVLAIVDPFAVGRNTVVQNVTGPILF